MTTYEQLADFSRFTRNVIETEDSSLPLAAIFDRWQSEISRQDDLARIRASVNDFENGERGEPAEQVIAQFRAERARAQQAGKTT